MEVWDIEQEAGIKTIPKKNKCKKAKWLSEEVLQIAEKRRETNGKGEKERYIHLNAEFQRIVKRDTKAFLGDQYKEIEETNRFTGNSVGKASAHNVGDLGSIPGSRRSPGEGNGNPLQ